MNKQLPFKSQACTVAAYSVKSITLLVTNGYK